MLVQTFTVERMERVVVGEVLEAAEFRVGAVEVFPFQVAVLVDGVGGGTVDYRETLTAESGTEGGPVGHIPVTVAEADVSTEPKAKLGF